MDEDGRYTGEMEFYAYGPFKAEAMRELAEAEGIDLEESSAYSDSYTDLPMLEAVGHPVAVNPDRLLAKVAKEREWEVMQFTKPIRLRDRVSVPSLPLTATAGRHHRRGLGGRTGGLAAGSPAAPLTSGPPCPGRSAAVARSGRPGTQTGRR